MTKSAIRPDLSTIDVDLNAVAALLGLSENQNTLQETSCEELITGINTPCDPCPSPQKLIGNINTARNTPTTPRSRDHNCDTGPVQIDSDHEYLARRVGRRPNSGAKRPAIGSAGSPKRKTQRINLSAPKPPERVKYQLILTFWLDEDCRSAQKLFMTGDNAWEWLDTKEQKFYGIFRNESDCRLFQHSREAVISGNTKSGKADKSSTFEIMDEVLHCCPRISPSSVTEAAR